MKTVVLVLGSGGLRGLAHIGVLKVLEKNKIPIDFIVGCSIGSVIGALYASGYTAKGIARMARGLKKREWIDFVVPKMGLFAGKKVLSMMETMTRQGRIEDAEIPLYIVATELTEGKEALFTCGSIAEAVRASTAVPGIFAPFEKGGKVYIDGAVTNPIPTDIARGLGADIVIGVDLSHGEPIPKIDSVFDVLLHSIDLVERQLGSDRYKLADVMIYPSVTHLSPSDFDCVREAIRIGEAAAKEMLPKIKRLLAE